MNWRRASDLLHWSKCMTTMNSRKPIDSGAEIIGVNNRDLQSFEVRLDTSLRLSYLMPSERHPS